MFIFVLSPVLAFGGADGNPIEGFTPQHNNEEHTFEQLFLSVPNSSRARAEHERLTREPHVAGSDADRRTAAYMLDEFRRYGLDATIEEFPVPLSEPLKVRFCVVGSPDHDGFCGPSREAEAIKASSKDHRVQMPFNAYSASGRVKGLLIYANYGSVEDYGLLKSLGVEIRGKIVIVRYGHLYRGAKARLAEQNGAAGLIIYSDPDDDGYHAGDVYPKGPWRPDSAIQRGSVLYDFLYPGLTASGATVPKIPVLSISSADARKILARLEGMAASRAWQGGLPFTYHLGPGPTQIALDVQLHTVVRPIWVVVARIAGTTFPDEIVVAGNHRDAWVYGGADPGSGTVALLEMARGLGVLLNQGWRPLRTILICSWDAEEQDELGSTAWAEKHASDISTHGVAYLNVDEAVIGDRFEAAATPSLKRFILSVAADTPEPSGISVLEQANARAREERGKELLSGADPGASGGIGQATIEVDDLGGGSDFVAFSNHFGIPSTDFSFRGDYGVYHSTFDDHEWMMKFGDPTFQYHVTAAKFFGLQVLRLSDADLLPFDYEAYGQELLDHVATLNKQLAMMVGGGNLDLQPLAAASGELIRLGRLVKQHSVSQLNQSPEPGVLRKINSALMNVERAFLLPSGLPSRPWFRHALFAPDINNGYDASVLPGVQEKIDAADFDEARSQIAAVISALNGACVALRTSYRDFESPPL